MISQGRRFQINCMYGKENGIQEDSCNRDKLFLYNSISENNAFFVLRGNYFKQFRLVFRMMF